MGVIMSSPFFSKYLSEIGAIPLLNREAESRLGEIVQMGLCDEATPIQREASEKAQCELIQCNLKLVVSVATRFLGSSLTLEELTFEGNCGLLEAARRFNPSFKTRFSTYATWWIQQAIREAIHRGHTVRMPIRRAALLRKILTCQSFMEGAPTQDLDAIRMETGITEQKISEILGGRFALISLNAPQPDGDESLESFIDSGCDHPIEAVIKSEEMRLAKAATSELSPQENEIISARFGLESTEPQTLESLAEAYGVSRERIRQIEKHALRKMRRKLRG